MGTAPISLEMLGDAETAVMIPFVSVAIWAL